MKIVDGVFTVSSKSRNQTIDITWQAGFFCEFDGPRSKKVMVRVRGQ